MTATRDRRTDDQSAPVRHAGHDAIRPSIVAFDTEQTTVIYDDAHPTAWLEADNQTAVDLGDAR